MNLGFVTAFGWSVLGLIAYAALMLVGALWTYAIREADGDALAPLVALHVLAFVVVTGWLALPFGGNG